MTSNQQQEKITSQEKCVICMDEIKINSVTLKCSHIFHQKCFSKMVCLNNKSDLFCPLCRQDIDGKLLIETMLKQLEFYREKYSKYYEKIILYEKKKKELIKSIFPQFNSNSDEPTKECDKVGVGQCHCPYEKSIYNNDEKIRTTINKYKQKLICIIQNNETLDYGYDNKCECYD